MAHRLYDEKDQRLYFLKQQKKFLDENKGILSQEELANPRFPPMDESAKKMLLPVATTIFMGKSLVTLKAYFKCA